MSRVRETSRLSQRSGMPVRPRRAEAGPSCIWPPLKSEASWAWMAMKRLLTLTYCSARRVIAAVGSGIPSSLKPTAPAAPSSPISVSSWPSRPLVTAAKKPTGTTASAPACSDEALEQGGVVHHRLGVGHAEGGDVTARRRGRRGGRDVLFVLATGRAEVRVQVDEPRQDEHAGRVDHARVLAGLEALADLGDLALLDEHVLHGVGARLGVDDAAALDQQLGGREGLAPRPFHQSTSPSAAPSL